MSDNRRGRRSAGAAVDGNVEMTPMIDVVFQLLIYFIVTITPMDVDARLDIFRPAAGTPPPETVQPPRMIQIQVLPGIYLFNERAVSIERLGEILERLGEASTTQTVLIMVSSDSAHERLIAVLDRCSRAGLTNLSVAAIN